MLLETLLGGVLGTWRRRRRRMGKREAIGKRFPESGR
jgi:hypothetical protein